MRTCISVYIVQDFNVVRSTKEQTHSRNVNPLFLKKELHGLAARFNSHGSFLALLKK